MKKWILMTFAVILYMPTLVFAKENISNYYIDLKVEKNGDVTVEELFILEGSFNGYERIIYHTGSTNKFDGSLSAFEGSDLYNGASIIIKEVKSISISNPTFSAIQNKGTHFKEVSYASSGDYGLYTVNNNSLGKTIRIYNPSYKGQRGFYIKYVITNMAIVHNDIAEIGFNLFTKEQKEDIDNLEMHIHIPNNQKELRAWGHGPLWGETKNIGKDEIHLYIQNIEARTPLDIRFVFDKNIVLDSRKKSHVDGLPSILTVEGKKAEEANQLREQLRNNENRREIIKKIFFCLGIGWLGGLFILWFHVYHKYDKEYKNTLPSKYYRDFPENYGPEVVGYLLHKQISNNDLSASILNLIYKKAIAFEEIEKNDYKLTNLHSNTLNETENKLIAWLFSNNDEVTLKSLKKEAKKSYSRFLEKYNSWKISAFLDGKNQYFYESSGHIKFLSACYSVIGFILAIVLFGQEQFISFIIALFAILSFVYFIAYQKRSVKGNNDYHKWMGLKHFMLDFGNMDDKELPEIVLWEKYLVYAVSLGCAKKLARTMAIKVKEMQLETDIVDIHRMNLWLSFHRNLSGTVVTAINEANNARIASSRNSSSGGFGGGFSGGGGSFGGGGGGGRF